MPPISKMAFKQFLLVAFAILSVSYGNNAFAQVNGQTICAAQYNGNLFTSNGAYDYPSGITINTNAGYWTVGAPCNPVVNNWLGVRTSGGIIVRYDWFLFSYPVYADGYTYTYHALPLDAGIYGVPILILAGVAALKIRNHMC